MKLNLLKASNVIFVGIMLFLLYLGSLYNYLIFHTVAEIFSICIAFTVFLISWNSIRYIKNNYLIILGIAYFFIGVIDLFHMMSYKGMQLFTDYDYYANQLWVAARYFESMVLLSAFIFVKSKKQANVYVLFVLYSAVTTVIMLSIFTWKVFPICFADGIGLTPFKKYSEYAICIILLISIYVLRRNRDAFERDIYRLLLASLVCTILSELCFTTYVSNYGITNLIGHYFKIFSFYLIYRTIISKGIREPYDLIFREMKQTEKQLFEQNEILKSQALIDGLTGLYNHRHLYEALEEETKRCSRNNCTFVVMILDIDHFKNINDTYGHLTGDKILKELSDILKKNTRQTDVVGRYGGEEFLIMLSGTKLSEGYEVAEKIRRLVEKNEFAEKILLTVSIGIEEYGGEKISDLLEKADAKLYVAKNNGRNRTIK